MAGRRERVSLSRAGTTVVQGTTLATLREPNLRPGAERSSPKPFYASTGLDLFACSGSGADDHGSHHLRQKQYQIGANRGGYASPRRNRPDLLFPVGNLLRLHGDLYLAIPRRDG